MCSVQFDEKLNKIHLKNITDILPNGMKDGDDGANSVYLNMSEGDVPVEEIPEQVYTICGIRLTKKKLRCTAIITLVLIFLLSLVGTIILYFRGAFSTPPNPNMKLVNETYTIQRIHVFNYTNVNEFMAGKAKKLRVQDVGPYTYKETRSRVNIVFNSNGNVTYQDMRSYQMMPELSVGAQYDMVMVPNLPMLSAIAMVKNNDEAKSGLTAVLNSGRSRTFKNLSIERFLLGYPEDLFKLAKDLLQLSSQPPPMDKFGILAMILNGIKAYRYSVPKDEFDSPETKPANQCFCHMDSGTCALREIFNFSPCAYGAPVMISSPHFYLGDPALVDDIDGLEPTADKHAMYIDIPGIPLAKTRRIQINIQVQKPRGTTGAGFRQLPKDIILPVAWIEQSMDVPSQEVNMFIYPWYTYLCVIFGLIVFISITYLLIRKCKNSRRSPLPVITTNS